MRSLNLLLRDKDIEVWITKLRVDLRRRSSQLVSPLLQVSVEQEFAYVLRCATYYASSSFRSNMKRCKQTLLCAVALTLLAVPAFGQATAIQPCPHSHANAAERARDC
jgi:hypothetical protein